MPGLNIPAGRKLVGANLVPNPAAAFTTGRRFEGMWSTEWDWAGWIKPQIDLALGQLGFNCIRSIGGHWGIGAGRLDVAQYTSRLVQVASYLKDRGAYFLLAGDSIRPSGTEDGSVPVATQSARYVSYLRELEPLGNVAGFDIVQEADNIVGSLPVGYYSTAYMRDMIQAIKAAGITIPLTYSTHEFFTEAGLNPANSATLWITGKAEPCGFDYIDLHLYDFFRMDSSQGKYLDHFLTNYGSLEIIVTETGKNRTVTDDAAVTDLSLAYRRGLSGHPRVRGVLQWAMADLENSSTYVAAGLGSVQAGEWGIYDTNTTPGTFIPRPHLVALARRFTGGSVSACNRR